nr:RNA-directed DNA polymerase, eukaryota [Tanacetum cinerariifolium]
SFLPKEATATRWVKFVPIKINVFAWKVSLDCLPTRVNLMHRGIYVSSLSCPICSPHIEDTSHLLFSCTMAADVTRLVCRWWDLVWSPLGSYSEWLSWFNSIRLRSNLKSMLEGVFFVTWWCLWNFRNRLLFAAQKSRKDNAKEGHTLEQSSKVLWRTKRFAIELRVAVVIVQQVVSEPGYYGLKVRGLVRGFEQRKRFRVSNRFWELQVLSRRRSLNKEDPFSRTMTDADKTAALKMDVYKKARSALLLCLDNKVLREVNKKDSAMGVWLKLETLYMTKSLANKLYLKKKLFTFYMHSGKKLSEHIDEFDKFIDDLVNIDVDMITLWRHCFMEEREGRIIRDHLKKDCPKRKKKKSNGFVKKNARQGSGMHSEGYDNGDLLMAMSEERFLKWIMDFGKVRVQMKDGSSFVLENVRYIPKLKRNLISLGTLDREGYTVKLQNGRVKVIKGSLMVLSGTMKGICVYSLDGWVESGEASVGIQKKESLAHVWHKRLGHISEAGFHELEKRELLGNMVSSNFVKIVFLENRPGGFGSIFLDTRTRRSASSMSGSYWWKTSQNGPAERMNKMLLNKVRCLLIQSGLLDSFWAEATVTATYLINRSPSTTLKKKTPMDLWSGHPANYEMLKISGCVAYSHVNQGKLKPRAIKCIFLGYPDGNLDNYVLVRDRAKRTTSIPARYKDADNGKSVSMPLGAHFKVSLKDCSSNDWDVERISKVPICECCREIVKSKEIKVAKIGMKDNAADAFIKVVPGKKLSEHIDEFDKFIDDLVNIDVDRITLWRHCFVEDREGRIIRDHLKKDCPKRKKKKSNGFVKKNAGQGSGMHSEGYDNGNLLMAMSEERFLKWIIDFGGSFHMTPRRDFLFDFKEYGGTILVGDNRACVIMGIGKVRVQMKDGSSFVLENVRYIPELKRNLISLGTLDREGYTVKLQNGRVKVIKGSLMVLSGTMKGNCVYSLDGWVESSEASVGIQKKESLAHVWHKRLGHISEAGFHELEKREVLGNMNGPAERMNKMLLNKVRCLLIQSGLLDSFSAEATVKAAYLINRSPSTALKKKTPMDLWSGHPANYEMLKIFGCVAYSHVNQGKLKPRAIKCIFLGYPDGVKGYTLWSLDDGAGAADPRKKVEFEVELQGSRIEPTVDPHTGENPRNEDEEQDEEPQQQNLDNYVLVRDRAKRTTFIPASKSEIEYTIGLLRKEFDMKELGAARKILGMKIVRDRGSLMYLMVYTRPDIAYAVSIVSRYLADPEAEYMALTEVVKENIWLKGLLIELGVNLRSVVLNCDNQSAIHLSKNAMFHERTKHINVRYHFIREIMKSKKIKVAKIGMKDNAADAFIKVVPGPKIKYCMEILGVGIN